MSRQILVRSMGGRRNLWQSVNVDDHVRESSSIVNLQRMRKKNISTQVHMRNVKVAVQHANYHHLGHASNPLPLRVSLAVAATAGCAPSDTAKGGLGC